MNKMPPNRSTILSIVIAVLLISIVLLWSGASSARSLNLQQTWPSRTPTSSSPPTDSPPGGQPTSEPPGGSPDDGTEIPPGGDGTATPVAGSTPIALAPTPIGGYLPTAEPCGTPPMAQSFGSVNVREGPGLDYDVIDILVYLEVRPVVGRASDATWWLIELVEESYGWVFDQTVFVSGYTGNVEIVAAPLVNGNTPTPGSPWEPTPIPFCTPPPTLTAVPTSSATPVANAAEVVLVTSTALPASPAATETVPPTATASPFPSETPEPTVTPRSATDTPVPAIASEDSESIDEEGSSTVSWLLIGAFGLIAAGAFISIVRRRS